MRAGDTGTNLDVAIAGGCGAVPNDASISPTARAAGFPFGLPHVTMLPESSSANPLMVIPAREATPLAPNVGSTAPVERIAWISLGPLCR